MNGEGKVGLEVKTPLLELRVSEAILLGCTKPIQDAYGLIGDWITDRRRHMRVERQERYKARAAQILTETQRHLRKLKIYEPANLSDKMLELAASAIWIEDDPTLQQLWAKLLADTMVPNRSKDNHGLASLLQGMPPEAARTFSKLVNLDVESGINLSPHSCYTKKRLLDKCNDCGFDHEAGLEHLLRLRVFEIVLIPLPGRILLPVPQRDEHNPELLAQSIESLEATLSSLTTSLPGQALKLTTIGQALRELALE
ncbi:hypothetical protein [Kordiimonas aestuarii]|uniref:hypothetical protein n=1 Tax=Kordiimonas aestuarii TaxID=1005925 RepID=UPI0021CECCF1|nr:hypothetical protein [Kordiimonas aestuarii]